MTDLEKDAANAVVIGDIITEWRGMDALVASLDVTSENGRRLMLLMREHQSFVERHWDTFVLPVLRRIEAEAANAAAAAEAAAAAAQQEEGEPAEEPA